MKSIDIVKLINEKPYLKYNLKKGMYGIVVKIEKNFKDYVFLSAQSL